MEQRDVKGVVKVNGRAVGIDLVLQTVTRSRAVVEIEAIAQVGPKASRTNRSVCRLGK